jgi:transcriptional regulator with XRE-family HTH domain
MSMGDRIKKRRQALGMSQQDLADLIRVSRQTIAQLESGVRPTMNTDTAKALARALGVSIDYLVGTWEEDQDSEREPATLAMVGA